MLIAAAALIPMAGACSAGQDAATAHEVAAVEGADAYRGGLALGDVRIATPPIGSYRAGDDAQLYGAISADDGTSDTLVSISTSAARTVALVPVPGSSSASGSSASGSPASGGSASASPALPSPAAPAELNLELHRGELLAFGQGRDVLELRGLTRVLTPGMTVRMTFVFAQAGEITLDVPVATPDTPEPRLSPSPRP